jgi:hypothetical protein
MAELVAFPAKPWVPSSPPQQCKEGLTLTGMLDGLL